MRIRCKMNHSIVIFALVLLLPSIWTQQIHFSYTDALYDAHAFIPENAINGSYVTNITDKYPNVNNKIIKLTYSGSNQAFYTLPMGNGVWNVYLNITLDYESQTTLTPVFHAEGWQGVQPTDITFTVHVLDVNDNAPIFQRLPYNAEVDENAGLNTVVFTGISATDLDQGLGGVFVFELFSNSSVDARQFVIIPDNGTVYLNGSLDYESRTFYHYKVLAKDKGSQSLTSTTDLFITVKDVQDSPPEFINLPYVASVEEDAQLSTPVLVVQAVDQDRGVPNSVNYSITHSTCKNTFQINESSGEISVAMLLDRDSGPLRNQSGLCTITVKATEVTEANVQYGNFTADATVSITIQDVNDNPPKFSQNQFYASINENSPPGSPLQLDGGQQIFVTDIDQGENSMVQLALQEGNNAFELVTSTIQSSGSVQLRVKNSTFLDFESQRMLIVQISASDGDNPPVTATVHVSILNENEFSPVYTASQYTAAIPEGSHSGTLVLNISASDNDADSFGTITYSLNNDRQMFEVDSSTGQVRLTSNQTDRELEDRYYLIIIATDGGGRQTTAPITINITDINDNPPVFVRDQYEAILDEGTTNFTRPVTVQAHDADEAETENSNVTYYITSTTSDNLTDSFRLDPITGQLSVTSALDFDRIQLPSSSEGIIELTVIATDNGTTKHSASVTIAVTLNDLNDNTPSFQQTSYVTNVTEGVEVGHSVLQVEATDTDGSSPNNLITYSIESGARDGFQINPDNGLITVSGEIDREQVSSYSLVIVARDRAAMPKSTSTSVTITATDVNDELPTFGGNANVAKDATEGTMDNYTMTANDPDSNAQLKYSILYNQSTGQSGSFQPLDPQAIEYLVEIDPRTGAVSPRQAWNRTASQRLQLFIQVTDELGERNTPQQSNATLTITVLDINDHRPEFSPSVLVHARIRENMGPGTALTFDNPFRVQDLDEGENSRFEVKVDTGYQWYFEVVPADIQSSADLLVRVKNGSLLDFETAPSLNLTLTAREIQTQQGWNSSVTIMLTIEDENDFSPEFSQSSYNYSVWENEDRIVVGNVTATDGDGSPEFNTVTYSLQGAIGLFEINSTTGEIRQTTNSLDYDILPNVYQLTASASDSGGRRNSVPVTVFLKDRNDLAPVFDREIFTAHLKEGATEFETALIVHAFDGDQPNTENSNISYTIISSEPSSLMSNFSIKSPLLGIIDIESPVDFESLTSPNINLTIKAEDHGVRQQTSQARVEITVEDVNDHCPTFSVTSNKTTVLENATIGTLVYMFKATDADGQSPNNDVYYIIVSGANDQFTINNTWGLLQVSRKLDRETVPSYNVVVLAIDKGVPSMTGTTALNITIDDVNDVPPKFSQSIVTVEVLEGASGIVYTVSASDEDENPSLQYMVNWTESYGIGLLQEHVPLLQSLFNLSTSGGSISTVGALDREVIQSAVFVLTVVDVNADTSGQTATGTVTINVKDLDDSPPEFSNSSLTVYVDENSAAGIPITMPQISVFDPDQGENSHFRLSIVDVTNTIEVLPASARGSTVVVLRVGSNNTLLDYEQQTSFSFLILAEGTLHNTMKSYCNVTLEIVNINDNKPYFTEREYTATINESAPIDTSVIKVEATDGDNGGFDNITYSLQGADQIFSIDSSSGEVKVSKKNSLDFETRQEYQLTLEVTDNGGLRDSVPLTIVLSDINDNPPEFLRPEYQALVKENSLHLESNVIVQAKDNDQPNTTNSLITYGIVDTNPSSNFTINSASGELGLTSTLDFEGLPNNGTFLLTITATDQGTPRRTGYVNLTVTVEDVNDCSPRFSVPSLSPLLAHVTENQDDSNVTTVRANDCDGSSPNKDIFYMIASGGNDQFKINSTSGQISTVIKLDRETTKSYSLIMLAIDRGSPALTSTATVSVEVTNVNDDKPKFQFPVVTVTPIEEQKHGSPIANFTAEDGDEDALLQYTVLWNQSYGFNDQMLKLQESDLQSAFNINNSTGVVTVNDRLDREAIDIATLIIVVQDLKAAESGQTATGTLSIQVQDSDDNAPAFSVERIDATIDENSPAGTPIQFGRQLTLDDPDKDINSRFNLSLSNYSKCLTIAPSVGRGQATVVIQVRNESCFDFEVIEAMDFQIIATPYVNESNERSARVHLVIKNRNDQSPVFIGFPYSKSILENETIGAHVITVNASDADKTPYNRITYTLQGGDDVFGIDNETGQVTVKKASLDYETRKEYQLTVEATDSGGLRDSVPLTITILDVNDNAPKFLRPEYQAFIAENSADFGTLIRIEATDDDSGQNKDVLYSISPLSDLANNFTINGSSGQFSVASLSGLDYESLPNITTGVVHLVIVACDSGSPQLCSNVSLLVTVEDENDNSPFFEKNQYYHNISEAATTGQPLITVSAADGDGRSPNNKVFYVMSGGGNDKFKVDSSTGLISRAGQLDSDSQNTYNLTINAIDGGSAARTGTAYVQVYVMDVNDVPPVFEPTSKIVNVNESNSLKGSDQGRLITHLWATDPDENSDLVYDVVWALSRGFGPNQENLENTRLLQIALCDQEGFTVTEDGNVTVNTTLDREKLSRAILVVNVTDRNAANQTHQTSTGTVTINVMDVNDHKPTFNKRNYTAEIQENAGAGSVLRMISSEQMSVSDDDTDQNCVFNMSVMGNWSAFFTVDQTSARSFALVQLRVLNNTLLDYEKRQTISFNVTATETDTSDRYSDMVTVTLNIQDVNDMDPVLQNDSYSLTIAESSSSDSITITVIQAVDADSVEFGPIHYSLEGDKESFSINATTGELTTAHGVSLDRETKDIYLMTIVAADRGGRRTSAPLRITISDMNDQDPTFPGNYSTSVEEDANELNPPVFVQATDNDQPNTANSNVTYRLERCTLNYTAHFALTADSGQLTMTSSLDFEQVQHVECIALAVDAGTTSRTGSCTISIQIQDSNDIEPAFNSVAYAANVTENSKQGTHVINVTARDGDGSSPNNQVFYMLDTDKGSDNFRINSTSGVITVGPGADLDRDRESDSGFTLQVLAIDRGNPPKSTAVSLSVLLLDENDELPVFFQDRQQVYLYENARVSDEVAVMNASDPDLNSHLVYSLLLEKSQASTDRNAPVSISDVSNWFRVDSETGGVSVGSALDRELAEVIVLTVMVNDTASDTGSTQTALATLSITLKDVNDNPPVIMGQQSLQVSESLVAGTEVASLTGQDADRDQNVTFSIFNDTEAYFNISDDGKILLKRSIDRESTPRVSFMVIATDSGLPFLTSNVTIDVTVRDANDNDPQFQSNTSYMFSVPENAHIGYVVAVVNATDADEMPNSNVTFDLADSLQDFVINTTTGSILVNRELDRETQASFSFGVAALDNPTVDVRRRVIQQVTIHVADVNDNAPVFSNLNQEQRYEAQLDETQGNGTEVLSIRPGTITASDKDQGENAKLSYMLIPGDAQLLLFRMGSGSGRLFVNENIRGKAGVYNYTVMVMDRGSIPLNATANLTIVIKDQNLNKPQFVGDYHDITVAECAHVGSTITTFTATDDDRDKVTNGKIEYLIDNTTSNAADRAYLTLNPDSGVLSFIKRFDRQKKASFQITVIARDKGLPASLTSDPLQVTINIADENNQKAEFNITHYSFSVNETQDNVIVGTVLAEDADIFKRTCYSIGYFINADLSTFINITAETDQAAVLTLTTALDRENPEQAEFSFIVNARDCTGTENNCDIDINESFSTATVQVTVLDVNDNPPKFTDSKLTVGVATTADTGHVIVHLPDYVNDSDVGSNKVHAFYPVETYELDKDLKKSLGPDDKPLALSINGSIVTRATLPGDAQGFFTWKIMANDSAGSDIVTLKIYVVGKDKLVRITFFKTLEDLKESQDEVIRILSQGSDMEFVADDRVPFEDDKGIVDPSKSVLVVHAVTEDEIIMDADELWDKLDHAVSLTGRLIREHKLINIETLLAAEAKETERTKTELILAAIIAVLVIAFAITLFLMINNIRRFKRKLKAATTETYAMSSGKEVGTVPGLKILPSNPIFGKEDYFSDYGDATSEVSDESLKVDLDSMPAETNTEEQEVTLDIASEIDKPSRVHGPQQYLNTAFAEHQKSKHRSLHALSNGVAKGHNETVNLHSEDDTLQELESTDI